MITTVEFIDYTFLDVIKITIMKTSKVLRGLIDGVGKFENE